MTESHFGTMRPFAQPRKNILLGARSVSLTRTPPNTIVENPPKPMIQFYWCVEGEVIFHYKNQEISLKPHHTFAYPYAVPHKLETRNEPVFFYYWTLDGQLAQTLLELNGGYQPETIYAGNVPLAKLMDLESAIKDLSYESEIKASAIAYELVLLSRTPAQQKETNSSVLVGKCIEYLNTNFSNPLTNIAQVAKVLNVSRNHLSRVFKYEQGVPPAEYLTHLRVQKGIELLKKTSGRVHEIAIQCGFEDPNYFARVLRKRIDDTPTNYRKS